MLHSVEAENFREEGVRLAIPPELDAERKGNAVVLHLTGDWLARNVGSIEKKLDETQRTNLGKTIEIDCDGINQVDTSGAFLIERLLRAFRQSGAEVSVRGVGEQHAALFDAVRRALDRERPKLVRDKTPVVLRILADIGKGVVRLGNEIIIALNIVGASIYGAGRRVTGKTQIRPAAIVNQMDRMGVRAVPIICLMSFLIGGIIAQQGAFQLRYFGAEIFVVDLVGILVLREIGVLLTAIMIAGRSGSAITAEIGSMKMREEVDALHVIGLNPIGVLVFPRLVALTLVLPLLAFLADMTGLLGAICITWIYSGIPPEAFLTRLRDATEMSTVFAGLIKAPFMAIIIGIVASAEGMKVGGSAESLGFHVTQSVVKSIFLVILVDGIFAIFYASIGY